jgi:hypothetical protein
MPIEDPVVDNDRHHAALGQMLRLRHELLDIPTSPSAAEEKQNRRSPHR